MPTRRTFLRNGVAVGAITVSGCLSLPGTKNKIHSMKFQILSETRELKKPVIVPSQKAETVVIEGTLRVSNGCLIPTVESVTYEPQKDAVILTVGSKKEASSDGKLCTQAITPQTYRLQLRFTEKVPPSYIVHEKGYEEQTYNISLQEMMDDSSSPT